MDRCINRISGRTDNFASRFNRNIVGRDRGADRRRVLCRRQHCYQGSGAEGRPRGNRGLRKCFGDPLGFNSSTVRMGSYYLGRCTIDIRSWYFWYSCSIFSHARRSVGRC